MAFKLLERLFSREAEIKQAEPENGSGNGLIPESLTALLIPDKILIDSSYKDIEGKVIDSVFTSYFDVCAHDIGSSILEGYDTDFSLKKKVSKQQVSYAFTNPGIKVIYDVKGITNNQAGGSAPWCTDVVSKIRIEELTLNLVNVRKMMRSILSHHLLRYNPASHQLLMSMNMEGTLIEGKNVLMVLDIPLGRAANYKAVSGFGDYELVKV